MLLMSGLIAVTSCSTIRSGTTSSEFCSGLLGAGGVSQGVSCVLVLTCSGPEQSGCLSVRAVLFFVFIPMLFSVRSGLAGLRRFRKQRSYHSSLGGFASDAFVALSSGYTCHSGAAVIAGAGIRELPDSARSAIPEACARMGEIRDGPPDYGLSAGPCQKVIVRRFLRASGRSPSGENKAACAVPRSA